MGFSPFTWEIMNSSGLMTITASVNVSGQTLTVAAPEDPVAAGLPATYRGPNGSDAFTSTEEGIVVRTAAGAPVVIHSTY